MKTIGFEREDEAIAWAKSVIGIEGPTGLCRALSAVNAAGEFVMVVVLSNFSRVNADIHIAAANGSDWATPREFMRIFRLVFGYAFKTLGLARVTGLVRKGNAASAAFCNHIGFVVEGEMRKAFEDGENLLIYGFLASDYEQHTWRSKYE